MRVLMLAANLPHAGIAGSADRVSQVLQYLAREHDVTLVALAHRETDLTMVRALRDVCARVEVFLCLVQSFRMWLHSPPWSPAGPCTRSL